MKKLDIVKANSTDSQELTKLTIKSKAIWGFSVKQLEKWKDELTISQEYIENNHVYKLLREQQIVAYYSYIQLNKKIVKLDNLFVHPDHIKKGCGTILLNDLLEKVMNSSFEKIILDSEPKAKEFYEKFDFEITGKTASSIPNRFLIQMEKKLK